jgi:hypothetical protein
MVLIVHARRRAEHMRIDLRGGQVGVAEHDLNGAEVAPRSSKCVANEWRSTCGLSSRWMPALIP